METLVQCPLCRSDLQKTIPSLRVDGWSIVTCPGCGVGITNPRPTLDEIGQYYRASFFSVRPDARLIPTCWAFARRRMTARAFATALRSIVLSEIKYRHDWTLQGGGARKFLLAPLQWLLALAYEPIQSLPGKPGVMLDIGFGTGAFLYRAKRLGWECHGVEVSATSVEWGRNLGFQTKQFDGSFRGRLDYPDNYFDLISANHVLEHVHDPRLALKECRRLLKPGGAIFIMVPNFECRDKEVFREHWRMWYPPQHLFHYTSENITALLREHGFGQAQINYKIWYNPITEKFSLKNIRPTVTAAEFRKLWWYVRIGKRLAYLRGRLSAAQIGPGMAVEAVKG